VPLDTLGKEYQGTLETLGILDRNPEVWDFGTLGTLGTNHRV
jgi:hypothetical protein